MDARRQSTSTSEHGCREKVRKVGKVKCTLAVVEKIKKQSWNVNDNK
jgi:hypothetical protein